MYVYVYSEVNNGVPLAWFYAKERSIQEVETMIKRKEIKTEFIKRSLDQILIAFTNYENYKLEPGEKYRLFVTQSNERGYLRISLTFTSEDYVAKMYRSPIDGSRHIDDEDYVDNYVPPEKYELNTGHDVHDEELDLFYKNLALIEEQSKKEDVNENDVLDKKKVLMVVVD